MEKGDLDLPPYTAAADPALLPRWTPQAAPRKVRHRRRILRLVGLGCLLFFVYAQWTHLQRGKTADSFYSGKKLSIERLQEDLNTCRSLRSLPQDAPGPGRAKNARFVDGGKPTLIRNATVWVGEPAAGTSAEDARAGKGYSWVQADVYLENGLIQRVAPAIALESVAKTALTYDAKGRQLTAGIIDMHSHSGVASLPVLWGTEDTNEMSSDTTPYVRSIDGIQPQDHQIQVIKSGGVTTSLILPGSGNNIGGEAYVIKHAVDLHDGRPELSIESLLAAPDAQLRYIKMACGENAKHAYGKVGEHGPVSRLGESWEFRHAFEQAAVLVQEQDDWCRTAEAAGDDLSQLSASLGGYLPHDLEWETLSAVLRGQVYVNTHCYTIPDLEAFVDHTNEFKFPVRAFHHAHQTFLVPEVLKRAWGADKFGPPASALFADNMYYKAESYVASEYAGKILYDNGLTPIYVSDNPVLDAQHVLFEAAKAYKYGLPYHAALASVTTAPAERLGLGERLGRIKPGFDADIVVWDSDPLSVGAAPTQVWIDGVSQFDDPVELKKPASAPIVPDEKLANIPSIKEQEDGPAEITDTIVFSNISKAYLTGYPQASADAPVDVAVQNGRIVCVGDCTSEVEAATANDRVVVLENGYLTPAFTAFGSHIGLTEIDSEKSTADGSTGELFTRAADGLALDTKKQHIALRYGVTRAITAPQPSRGFTHFGTSAGYLVGAKTVLDKGAVFHPDASLHYTLSESGKRGSTPTSASVVAALRAKLLKAVSTKEEPEAYTEAAYLAQVVTGKLPLVLTVHSADTIASILLIKKEVEEAIAAAGLKSASAQTLRLVVLGGAESYLVADKLAEAKVGVVLAPLQSYATSWEERRALTGAPLTNGTAVDVLLDAGVTVAIGLDEDWIFRDLGLLAGIAYKNGEGRLTEKTALDLVSTNVYSLLGSVKEADKGSDHFIVHEGNPLEIGSRIKAVSGGLGHTLLF